MSILSGHEIANAYAAGEIAIDPYDASQLNPASYDLRLGNQVAVYFPWVHNRGAKTAPVLVPVEEAVLDVRQEPAVHRYTIGDTGWLLRPGILYLMHTVERIGTDRYVALVDGKSSVGRLGISIHQTAGFGDPGYFGQYTLEVTTIHPVRVYAGMRIAQIRFHMLTGAVQSYQARGHYTGTDAIGPVPSKAWRQFWDDG